jgi:hypothetical protein
MKVQFIRENNGKEEVIEKKAQMMQKDRTKCFTCNKKVGLLGIECKCSLIYCNNHRLPELHLCAFNHNENAKKKLEAELIKVDGVKLKKF